MSNAQDTPALCESSSRLRTDTLADSVLILLALTVVQRGVGFVRALLFCRWMDPEDLGTWDLAFSFLLIAAPLSVLSLSSSFRRYVEYYRQQFQLRMLLRRTAMFHAVCGASAVAILWLFRGWFSQLVFGSADHQGLIVLLAVSLVAVLGYHFFIDLITSLRNVRLISSLQLLHSVVFAAVGIVLLVSWEATAASVVAAYGAACVVASMAGVAWLIRSWTAFPQQGEPPPQRRVWSKLVPFAAWVWVGSLMGGLFGVADRYMIVHFAALAPDEALGLVGQYHSSRVLPLLLMSVAAMLASVVTPHLSHDWEAGRKDGVRRRLNLYLKLTAFGMSVAGAGVALVAPMLFSVAFEGKYAGGLEVLPWSLTYCIWFGLNIIAQNYLWCIEKTRLASVALLAGLVTNVGLNLVLLPRLGLMGAVLATTMANVVALLLVIAFNRRLGFKMDRGTWVAMGLPPMICMGPWFALALLAAVAVEATARDRLLTPDEKHQLVDAWSHYRDRFRTFRLALRSAG